MEDFDGTRVNSMAGNLNWAGRNIAEVQPRLCGVGDSFAKDTVDGKGEILS